MAITVKHSKTSTIPDGSDTDLIRPSDWNADHTLTGLGTMAEQNANNVAITGGSVNGTTVGATTAAAVTGTTVTATTKFVGPYFDAATSAGGALRNASGTAQVQWGAGGGNNVTFDVATNLNPANAQVDISPTGTGHVHINPAAASTMDNVAIGETTPTSGKFTTLSSNANTSFSGANCSISIQPTGTGVVYVNPATTGAMDNMSVGQTTAAAGKFTDFEVTGTFKVDNAEGTSGQVLTSQGAGVTPVWTTPTTGTVTNVTGTAPIASSGGTTPAISISQATTSTNGYLSSTDWNTFNNKQPAGSYLTAVTADSPLSGSGTSGSHLVIAQANTSTSGYLSSTDWNTFNNKQAALISGTNIKTVNGTTLLGSGDLGTITAAYGGTGLTSPGTSGNVLTSNGSAWVSSAPSSGVTKAQAIAYAMTLGF